jgi:hypothetical protein
VLLLQAEGSTSLNHDVEMVKVLLTDTLVDPSVFCNALFRFASREGNLALMKVLLSDKRIDPSIDGDEARAPVHRQTTVVRQAC